MKKHSVDSAQLSPATIGELGLFPGESFRPPDATATERNPEPLWFFRHETVVVPQPDTAQAGFAREMLAYADIAAWQATTPLDSEPERPPVVWIAAPYVANGVRISSAIDGSSFDHKFALQTPDGEQLLVKLQPRHPLNRSYADASSIRFLSERSIRVRGEWEDACFHVRTFWPEDFRLPMQATQRPILPLQKISPHTVRKRIRERLNSDANAVFSVETLWRRATAFADTKVDTDTIKPGQAVLAFILNGAQSDDDEAHGGHFAIATGRVGEGGAIHDWMVSNYYSLASESEKGIIAGAVPLDNYFADLNAGQAWYRPSCMLVATLRDVRTAAFVQSALGRVFQHFYRDRLSYQHARANCAGISINTLRAVGWAVPNAGPESWLRAIPALPLVAIISGSLKKGKAVFDYLTEDRTVLYPSVAFEQITADLLRLVSDKVVRNHRHGNAADKKLSEFEKALADDIDNVLLVRLPQLPSSRGWGSYPVVSSDEYHARVPKDPTERQIIPVVPRPFPKHLIDPEAPREPWLRSDYALTIWIFVFVILVGVLSGWVFHALDF